MKNPLFTVCIPTRDRCAYLAGCLDSLAAMDFPRDRFEVVILDNGSVDRTRALAEEEARRDRIALRYAWEARPGRGAALNGAIAASRGDFIIVVDDDALVDSGWLAAYERALSAGGHQIVQGRVLLRFEGERPGWLADEYLPRFSLVDPGGAAGPYPGALTGCNMGFARAVFDRIGMFRADLGAGASGFGEDTEFGMRAREAGCELWYEPGALILHLIPPQRTTRAAWIKRFYASGYSMPLFRAYPESRPRTLANFARSAAGRLFSAAFARSDARRMAALAELAEHWGRVARILKGEGHA